MMKNLPLRPRLYHKRLFIFALILLAVSLAALAWWYWPLPEGQASLTLSPEKLQALLPAGQTPVFLLQEGRRLELQYPAILRVGEKGQVTLRWETTGATATPASSDIATSASTVMVETRLDLMGIAQNPSGVIESPLVAGQTLLLQWQITPGQAGRYSGVIWSYLGLADASGGTEQSYQPIAAQDIQVQVISLLGLDASTANWLGAIGLVSAFAGIVFSFLAKPKKRAFRGRQKGNRKQKMDPTPPKNFIVSH